MAKSSDYNLKVKEKELAEKFKQAEREYLKQVKKRKVDEIINNI